MALRNILCSFLMSAKKNPYASHDLVPSYYFSQPIILIFLDPDCVCVFSSLDFLSRRATGAEFFLPPVFLLGT